MSQRNCSVSCNHDFIVRSWCSFSSMHTVRELPDKLFVLMMSVFLVPCESTILGGLPETVISAGFTWDYTDVLRENHKSSITSGNSSPVFIKLQIVRFSESPSYLIELYYFMCLTWLCGSIFAYEYSRHKRCNIYSVAFICQFCVCVSSFLYGVKWGYLTFSVLYVQPDYSCFIKI